MVDTFHLLRIGKNQYLTMKPPKSQTMFLTFKNMKTANKCKEYIEHHKEKYGSWPSLDMGSYKEQLEMDRMSQREPLYIEQKSFQDIEELMQRSGAGVMYCHEFGMIPLNNSFTITFRAQEMQVELDFERYLESLEDTIGS